MGKYDGIVPEHFRQSMIGRHGDEGNAWCDGIPKRLEGFEEKYGIHDIELIPHPTINLVFYAKHDSYGDVILKVGYGTTSRSEFASLAFFDESVTPKVYVMDLDEPLLIMERIRPGKNLFSVEDRDERFEIFFDIFNRISGEPVAADDDRLACLRTFMETFASDWEAFDAHPEDFSDVAWARRGAAEALQEIRSAGLPLYVLHDDLFHLNIISNGDGWSAIDSHGLIGERPFELVHFLTKELSLMFDDGTLPRWGEEEHGWTCGGMATGDFSDVTDEANEFADRLVDMVCERTGEDARYVADAMCVNAFLKIMWFLRTGQSRESYLPKTRAGELFFAYRERMGNQFSSSLSNSTP